MSNIIAVSGKSGFIGRHMPIHFKAIDLRTHESQWDLRECKTVVHLSGVAHKTFSSEDYQAINVDLTVSFARKAIAFGVTRFVYLSTMNVHWVESGILLEDLATKSKREAENQLSKLCENYGIELVIIRAPLVYGKDAPGNFGTLLRVAEKNLPLPLGAINNQRSFVAIDNLVDLIVTCIDHPNAANQTFLVSDDEEISTSNLLKKLTLAAGKKPWLIPVPVPFLKFIASMVGKKSTVESFSSSLTVDIGHTKNTLNWNPPITLDEGIRRCFK